MRCATIRTLAVAATVALFLAGCAGKLAPTPAPPQEPVDIAAPGSVVVEGKAVPVQGAALSFRTGGVVAEVPVAVGDQAGAGQELARLETGRLDLQLRQAEAELAAAQAALARLRRGPSAEERAAAQQDLASAEAAYQDLLHPGEDGLTALRTDVEKAQALLAQAQAAYDRIGGDSRPGASGTPQRAELQIAWLDCQKAQALYNARLNPSNAQKQQALAAVQAAKDRLARLEPPVEELAAAQARVDAAQAARDLVARGLEEARLLAPFAGNVTWLGLRPSEYVAPGVPVVQLADTARWQVETTDLTELNVVAVHEGALARVTFDAIPGLELPGKVARVQGYGENRQGDVVYTAVIALDQQDQRLRWNMTARVTIETPQ